MTLSRPLQDAVFFLAQQSGNDCHHVRVNGPMLVLLKGTGNALRLTRNVAKIGKVNTRTMLSRGDPMIFVNRPINVSLLLVGVSLLVMVVAQRLSAKSEMKPSKRLDPLKGILAER